MSERPRDIQRLLPSDDEIEKALLQSLQSGAGPAAGSGRSTGGLQDVRPNTVVKGRVIDVLADVAVIDLSYKSEGVIPVEEFPEPGPEVGAEIEALVVELENEDGQVGLSIQEAARQRLFESLQEGGADEGTVFTGKVVEAVKGGLVVDVGMRAFLPARELDLRYVEDLEEWVGRRIDVEVIETDPERGRVIVSRRKLLQSRRDSQRAELFSGLSEGDVVKGTVSNLTDFGAFVDLGGADGLIHRNDLAWGRVGHPSEVLQVGQEVEATVLKVDRERGKIGLGLKQAAGESPWTGVETRYFTGRRTAGKVTELLDFGALVELEPGIEGLVHVSEMRWGRRVNRPSEVVKVGDDVEVEVLGVDPAKRRISLSMKVVEENPWSHLEQRFPFASIVRGKVTRLEDFGAFVEVEDGVEGLVHVSELSWTRRVEHPAELLSEDQEVTCIVLGADEERRRLSLSIKQCEPDPWEEAAEELPPGTRAEGTVTGFAPFGAFVELSSGVSGLVHVSRMGQGHVERPQQVLKHGQTCSVEVLEIDPDRRRISLKLLERG